MSILAFLKVFGDICLCYAVMGSFPALFVHDFSLIWPAVLCGAGVSIGVILSESGRGRLRLLALLLPLSLVLLCDSALELLLVIPAIVYAAVVIIRGDFSLEYYSFQALFRRCLTVLSVFFIVVMTFHLFEISSDQSTFVMDHENTFLYGLMYAAAGVILQRQLRIGTDGNGKDPQLIRSRTVVSLCGISAFLIGIVVAERLLRDSASSVIRFVLEGFALIVGAIGWVLSEFFNSIEQEFKEQVFSPPPTSSTTPTNPLPTFHGGTGQLPQEEPIELGFPWWLAVLVVLVMVVIMVCLLMIFRPRGNTPASAEVREKSEPQKRERPQLRRSNRNKVRHYYRQFLRAERKKGLKQQTNQTSADILQKVSPDTDHAAAERLREVYLHARYDEKNEITQEQVDAAKAALKKTRGG